MLTHRSANALVSQIQTTALAQKLLESDRRYFAIDAHLEVFENATIAAMPGLVHIPAGCVVH